MEHRLGRESPMRYWFLICFICSCAGSVGPQLSAQEPSPAEGNYLDLREGICYVAPDSPFLDAELGDEWTIEMWLYFRKWPPLPPEGTTHTYVYIFDKAKTYRSSLEMRKWIGMDEHTISFFSHNLADSNLIGNAAIAYNGPGIFPEFFDGNIMEQNQWHNVVIQQHQHLRTVYFDGVRDTDDLAVDAPEARPWEMQDTDSSFVLNPSKDSLREAYGWGRDSLVHYPFDGAIDELRISNIARYPDGPPLAAEWFVSDRHTMALWHFDEPQGSAEYADSSGNGNTLFSREAMNISNPRCLQVALWGRFKQLQ